MATKGNARKKATAGTQGATDAQAQTPESLDQVRDILFGGQMRAVESRLERMEKRIMREVDAARADGSARADASEALAKKDLKSLTDKLQAERTKRADEVKAVVSELRDSVKDLDARLASLDNETSKADAELRDQILKLAKTVSTKISKLSDTLSDDIQRVSTELRAEKADTSALIALFSDMAVRLTEELPVPPGK